MNKDKKDKEPRIVSKKVKFVILGIMLIFAIIAGKNFWTLRHYVETFVPSDALTEVKWLSDYEPSLKGSWNDTPVYIFDSGVEGGTVFYMANVHPYEPACALAAYILMENIQIDKGRVIVVPQGNFSASTLGVCGNAYPPFHHVKTEWGEKKFKIGDRNTNPLDQWPDPFTYVNYPSGQNLAYQDIRNMNRTYPGRPNGTQTERASYAIMELIRQEEVDISIDTHEASIMYPVVSTYVAPDKSLDIAMMASMNLTDMTFDMKCEASPKSLKGLSHREWGDYSDTLPFLMETPEPFIDRITGPVTEALCVDGKDEFLAVAAEHGLTFVPYTYEFGSPMWYRCGRHLSGALEVIFWAGGFNPEMEVICSWPTYEELEEHDCGYFLHDPNAPENVDKVQKVYHKPLD